MDDGETVTTVRERLLPGDPDPRIKIVAGKPDCLERDETAAREVRNAT
jgi:hypothetical protein